VSELIHDAVDRGAQRVAAGDMGAASDSPVEHQPGQMRAHCSIDDVGDCFVLARHGVQSRYVDTGDVTLSHTR
jgi:hypothetical protein